MTLLDLRPRFWRWMQKGQFQHVDSLAEADAIIFLCPACFIKNNGPVGTHSIRIDFRGRRVPDEDCMRNNQGVPVRWDVSGDGYANLTLAPSIQILSGCCWHGFVQNGQIVHA